MHTKLFQAVALAAGLVVGAGVALAHCEIPCGIYGDMTRVKLLQEHITTVEKSMAEIKSLAGKTDAQSLNQLTRWIENKDRHAEEIQHVVTQYFMTQRVKPAPEADKAARERYLIQLTSLHDMLVSAMKTKQTVDPAHCEALRKALDAFAASYFSPEDLKHIREHDKGK